MLQVLKMITRKEKLRKIATLGGPEVQERGQFRSSVIRGSVLTSRNRAEQEPIIFMFSRCFWDSLKGTFLQLLDRIDRSRRTTADYNKSKKGLSPWTV